MMKNSIQNVDSIEGKFIEKWTIDSLWQDFKRSGKHPDERMKNEQSDESSDCNLNKFTTILSKTNNVNKI